MVLVNGSANNDDNEVGVILISSQGEETKLAMRLQFLVSNNEAKNKALLIELCIAQNVKAA